MTTLYKYFETHNNYLNFCDTFGVYAQKKYFQFDTNNIKNPLIIFTYLFGTKEMMQILIPYLNITDIYIVELIQKLNSDTNIIDDGWTPNDLDNETYYNTNCNIEYDYFGNLITFLTKLDLKNKWNLKSEIIKKIPFKNIAFEILDNSISNVKEILNTLDINFKNQPALLSLEFFNDSEDYYLKFCDQYFGDQSFYDDINKNLQKLRINSFETFCEIFDTNNNNYKIDQQIVIFAFLFGSDEMLNLVEDNLGWNIVNTLNNGMTLSKV
jgi:hypothetical protein